MPYVEPEDYARDLVARHTEYALNVGRQRSVRTLQRQRWAGVAASLLLVLSGTLWLTLQQASTVDTVDMEVPIDRGGQQSPLDAFLEGISDEEASFIECCEIEEVEDFAP